MLWWHVVQKSAKEVPLLRATSSAFASLMPLGKKEVSVENNQGWSLFWAPLQVRRGISNCARGEEALGVQTSGAWGIWGLKAQPRKRLRATKHLRPTEPSSGVPESLGRVGTGGKSVTNTPSVLSAITVLSSALTRWALDENS